MENVAHASLVTVLNQEQMKWWIGSCFGLQRYLVNYLILGYHGSITLAVSSTCPCLLLNPGIISEVADGAMVLFKLALMKLHFGLMNLMLIPRLGNVWKTIKNMRTTPFCFVVLFVLVMHMTCVGMLALPVGTLESPTRTSFVGLHFVSFYPLFMLPYYFGSTKVIHILPKYSYS